MDQNANDLNIQITATDDASKVFDEVAKTADTAAKSIADAGSKVGQTWEESISALQQAMDGIPNLLSPAETAVVEQAQAMADSWDQAMNGVSDAAGSAATAVDEDFQAIASAADNSARSTIATWEESLQELQTMMSGTTSEIDAQFAAMAGGGKKGGMDAVMGYFRYYMLGSMAQKGGQSLMGIDTAAIAAAASGADKMQIQTITDHINQLQASMASQSASLEHNTGTSDQIRAKHALVAAEIAKEKTQVELLQKQLAPLKAEYQVAGDAAQKYADAQQKLTTDWQKFLATVGLPLMIQMTKTIGLIDDIVNKLTAWAKANPELANEIMKTIGILGIMLTVIGGILLVIAPIILVFSLFGVALSATAVAGAALIAALIAAFVFFEVWFTSHVQQWSKVLQGWGADLRTTIGGAIAWIESFFKTSWATISKGWQDFWNGIYNFLLGIVSKVESAVQNIINAIKKLPGNVISGVTNTVQGAGSELQYLGNQAIKAFASGGIVNGPTLALVGEAGPEAIIPLDSFAGGGTLAGAGISGGGGNIIVNITGTFMSSQAARQMADMVTTQLNRQVRLRRI